MASYSFITQINVKKLKYPFDLVLSLDLVKDFWKWKFVSLKKDFLQRNFKGLI
jgi:hypothetical protein